MCSAGKWTRSHYFIALGVQVKEVERLWVWLPAIAQRVWLNLVLIGTQSEGCPFC